MSKSKEQELTRRDWLAIERTKLANERTFLAYFRTALVLAGTGVSILKIDFFAEVQTLGWVFVGIAPALLAIGILRTFRVQKRIKKTY